MINRKVLYGYQIRNGALDPSTTLSRILPIIVLLLRWLMTSKIWLKKSISSFAIPGLIGRLLMETPSMVWECSLSLRTILVKSGVQCLTRVATLLMYLLSLATPKNRLRNFSHPVL